MTHSFPDSSAASNLQPAFPRTPSKFKISIACIFLTKIFYWLYWQALFLYRLLGLCTQIITRLWKFSFRQPNQPMELLRQQIGFQLPQMLHSNLFYEYMVLLKQQAMDFMPLPLLLKFLLRPLHLLAKPYLLPMYSFLYCSRGKLFRCLSYICQNLWFMGEMHAVRACSLSPL